MTPLSPALKILGLQTSWKQSLMDSYRPCTSLQCSATGARCAPILPTPRSFPAAPGGRSDVHNCPVVPPKGQQLPLPQGQAHLREALTALATQRNSIPVTLSKMQPVTGPQWSQKCPPERGVCGSEMTRGRAHTARPATAALSSPAPAPTRPFTARPFGSFWALPLARGPRTCFCPLASSG